jgi:hypothetical protein
MMNKYKCVLISIFFIVFLTCFEALGETKYFSPTGEEITKEKYDEIAAEYKNKINQKEKLKEAQETTPTIETKEKVQSKYTSQGYDMFGKPTNDPSQYDCKGRPYNNKDGNRITYPDDCGENRKEETDFYSCRDNCVREYDDKRQNINKQYARDKNSTEQKISFERSRRERSACVRKCAQQFPGSAPKGNQIFYGVGD